MWICPKCGKELSREDQHHFCVKPKSIDEYISQQDEAVRPQLETIREIAVWCYGKYAKV